MDFTSLSYFAFLGIVFFLYWLVPDKFRNIVIVVFSYVFYYFINFKYVLFLIALTCISYYLAMSIGKCSNNHNKKILLFISVSSILLTLFILKYFNFTISIISSIVSNDSKSVDSQVLNLILPVGISFYSFEIIGYLVDVYYGKTIAEANFINYAAFIAFFPQLLAGPIARSQRLLPQIKNQKKFLYANGIDGIKRIELGLFEKSRFCTVGLNHL